MSQFVAPAAAAAVFTVIVLAACSGSDPDLSTLGDGGSAGDAAVSCAGGDSVDACGATCEKCVAPTGGTTACAAGACVAACPSGTTLCGTACVDLESTATNCGACGHSCNGGSCASHTCGAIEVASGFTSVNAIAASPMGIVMAVNATDVKRCGIATGCTGATLSDISTAERQRNLLHLAVAGSEVFWDGAPSDPWIVWHCPLTGCPATGEIVVESTNDGFGALVAGPTDVYWTIASYYSTYSHRCALPACSSYVEVRPEGPATTQYNSSATPTHEMTVPSSIVSVGAQTVLWNTGSLYNDPTKFLRSCPLHTPCPTPLEIDTAPTYNVSALTYYAGQHYGASASSIFSVADVVGTTARTPLAVDAAGINGIAADASGIYWINGTTGNVRRCAKLAGCAAGEIETLATGQVGVTAIAIDDANVYWAMPTKVMRVVK